MLSPLQRQALCYALASVCPTFDALAQMLRFRTNQQLERITAKAGVDEMCVRIVEHAENEFWTANLIAGLVATGAANGEVVALLAAYPELDPRGAPPAVNHYDAKLLVGGRLFLSRPDLRRALREMGEGISSRVLIVNGEPVTGKSFTHMFVSYVLEFDPSRRSEGFRSAYIDLDQKEWTLETLAKQIAFALKMDPETMPKRPASDPEQDSRWLPQLHQWLCDGITTATYPGCWLILDGFRVSLPAAGLDLIQMLAEFADIGANGRLRLVLLNFPRADALPYSGVEVIGAPPLGRRETEAFLADVFAHAGQPHDAVLVQAALQSVETQVDQKLQALRAGNPDDPDLPRKRLQLLNVALSRTAKRLLAGAAT